MKPRLGLLALSAPIALASIATADLTPVIVDFSSVPPEQTNLTTASPTVDGVTISYAGPSANVSASGISGDSTGTLTFGFSQAIGSLKFNWTVENVSGQPADPGLMLFADNGETVTLQGEYSDYNPNQPGVGHLVGTLSYQPVNGFMSADAYFSIGQDARVADPNDASSFLPTTFSVSSLAYSVPEPTIIGLGLAVSTGLLVRRRAARAKH